MIKIGTRIKRMERIKKNINIYLIRFNPLHPLNPRSYLFIFNPSIQPHLLNIYLPLPVHPVDLKFNV